MLLCYETFYGFNLIRSFSSGTKTGRIHLFCPRKQFLKVTHTAIFKSNLPSTGVENCFTSLQALNLINSVLKVMIYITKNPSRLKGDSLIVLIQEINVATSVNYEKSTLFMMSGTCTVLLSLHCKFEKLNLKITPVSTQIT